MGRDETPSYGPVPDFRLGLLHDAGWGFVFGAACGTAFHFLRGLRRSPSGGRLAGAASAVRANAPRVAGSLGTFFAVFYASECAMSTARGREDGLNSIAAGAATSGIRRLRRGPRQAAASALTGAAFVALVQGAIVMFDRKLGGRPYTPMCCRQIGYMTPDSQWQHPAAPSIFSGVAAGEAHCGCMLGGGCGLPA